MRRWFDGLPIHRKLVAFALLVSALALALAMLWLSVFDIWRYRASSSDEVTALADVLAENTTAAVAFDEPQSAADVLRAVRVRDVIVRACIFLPDGRLFAQFARSEDAGCPARLPTSQPWNRLAGTASIERNDRVLGTLYVERDLSDLRRRMTWTAVVGLAVFAAAALAAYLLALRVHIAIADPISSLATFAKRFRSDTDTDLPEVGAPADEVGDLAAAFRDMIGRIRAANRDAQKALAREREANRLKDEFLAAVSHELRTPLNAMMGWAQLLDTDPSADTVRQAAASIVKNARAQTRVIEDLIDVSRIATGKMRLAVELVDFRTVVTMACDTIQPMAEAKGVGLERVLPEAAVHVMGDRDRLVQILWNLLSNSVKFTPRGGRVSVELSRVAGLLRTTVRDTGPGIATAFLPHVFERFRQADGSTTRAHGGLGIGLAIVKELTELHGGTVTAHSDGPDRGATFTVGLPEATMAQATPSVDDAVPSDLPLPSLAGLSILAVDDNDDALALVAAALRGAGARVETASSASQAMDIWRGGPLDVLVCDLAMPGIGGIELLEGLRAQGGSGGRVTPAIAVSAYASEADRARSLGAGFDDHITKPFSRDVLIRVVAAAAARG